MSLDNALQGMCAYYDTQVIAASASLYRKGNVPHGTARPYVTYEIISEGPTWQSKDSADPEAVRIQFSIFADTDAQAVTLRDSLRSGMDAADFAITEGTLLYWKYLQAVGLPEYNESGEPDGFAYHVDYQMIYE